MNLSSKSILLFAFIFFLLASLVFSETYYVKPDGDEAAAGTSWQTAFKTITKALSFAIEDDHIWVKEGTYQEGDTITIPEGISLYGGFAGEETSLEERNISDHPTIIDGEKKFRCVINMGTIDGFHVTNGFVSGYKDGGGIDNYQGIVSNCRVYSNSSDYAGGGIYNNEGTISNCTIYSNSADSYGGGLYTQKGTVSNCIFHSNSAGVNGGGIYNIFGKVIHCTLYSNSALYGGGIFTVHYITITNCISWKNEYGDIIWKFDKNIDFSCYSEAYDENGNIRGNPLFMNTSGDPSTWDFHLQNGSPCIDAGTLENATEEDIEGNPRPGGDDKVCMGAYESPDHYSPLPPLSSTRIYVSKSGNNTNGNSWEDAYTSITVAISSIGDDLCEIWVGKGVYQEGDTVFIPGSVDLYGGFAGIETSLEQRNISEHPTIIDGEKTFGCVYNYRTIDGFQVINGLSSQGGGIYNQEGIVSNCILYSNSADSSGGIYNNYGKIVKCTLYSNTSSITAKQNGSAIGNHYGTVTNCILYSNSGGIGNYYGTIINCTLYSNSELGISNHLGTIINSISWNNGTNDIRQFTNEVVLFSCYAESNNENGNIRFNPLFMNTSGDPSTWDFHLQNGSPCIDAGTMEDAPEEDIEGNPRPGGDGKVCMGAYESPDHYIPMPPQTSFRLYVSKTGNNTTGQSWEDAYTSITTALSSLPGDYMYEIWVKEGICQEGEAIHIPGTVSLYGGFSGTESSLQERNFFEHITLIDGNNEYRCAVNYGILDGFHIKNGDGFFSGGGVLNKSGGIVANCIISYGSATYGGGIYNEYGKVTNCTLYSNSADYGGGIDNNNGTVSNCILYSNSADYGGGIYNHKGSVINCTLYFNASDDRGGGIYSYNGTITNCTLYSNKSDNGGGIITGEGIETAGTIINCISWNNSNEDIIGKPDNIFFSCYGESHEENGNIRCNPLFVNTSGDFSTWDFHLQNGSPCIDSGTIDTAQLPDQDIEGNPRPGGDGKVCMGAYESPDHYIPLSPQPPTRIYVSKNGNNTNGNSWENAYTSVIPAIPLIMGDNLYEIWVEEGTYKEGAEILVPLRVNLHGGFAGTETSLEGRNISEHPTIIDGEKTYRCIYNLGTVDGFSITNGYAYSGDDEGGGICISYGRVTNCTLYSNRAFDGGGIYSRCGRVTNCTLNSNSAEWYGGGIYNYSGKITNCSLNSNISVNYGGGINNIEGQIINCTLFSNSVQEYGGGISNSDGFIYNSIIHFNTAGTSGGGIYNNTSNSIIYNCIISSNTNWGIYNNQGSVYNSTFFNNKGGIYNTGNVMNSICWKNGDSDILGGTISFSCFKEADGTDGNINADPLLIKLDGDFMSWIYQVKNGSPCIDAGNPDESYNDGCQPPGKGGVRNDMGAYGGPYNCNWGVNIGKHDLIDFLTGRKTLYGLQFPFADRNSDDKVDTADLIDFILSLTSPTPKFP